MKQGADNLLHAEQAAYLEMLEPPRDAVLVRMEARAKERGYPISDPEVASFLAVTAESVRPRFIFELGANIGYGAVVLARAAGPESRVLTIEKSPDLCREARGFVKDAGLETRVEVREGDAIEELTRESRPIDLAYVDCVKEDYPRYLALLVPRLAPGGLLIADNVLWKGLVARGADVPHGERARTEAIRAFNAALVREPSMRAVVLPLGDGVAYAVKHR